MPAVGQDLALEFIFEIAAARAVGGETGSARAAKASAMRARRRSSPSSMAAATQIAHLHGERAHELAIGGQFRARQDEVRMLEPGDDALGGHFRRPGETADALAEHAHPVIDKRARIGGGKLAMSAFEMAQPAETVKCRFPFGRWRLDGERRQSAGFDKTAGEREAAVVELLRKLRVRDTQIGRRDQDAIGRKAGEAPAIKRPHAQAAAEFAPGLCNGQSPQVRVSLRATARSFSVLSVIILRPFEQPVSLDTIVPKW